jgi:2-polyprenyl-6-methoxyphenol hydroxylase-like FAD-dependent oxidoreductase
MRIAEPLLRKGVKIYDIAFWKSSAEKSLHRTGREIHYPPVVDLLDPYILLVHQGMVEGVLEDDLRERGVVVSRNTAFTDFDYTPMSIRPLTVNCQQDVNHAKKTFATRYIVGCDGAHSKVRRLVMSLYKGACETDTDIVHPSLGAYQVRHLWDHRPMLSGVYWMVYSTPTFPIFGARWSYSQMH